MLPRTWWGAFTRVDTSSCPVHLPCCTPSHPPLPFPLPFPSPHLQKHKKTVNAAKDLVGVLQNLDRTDDAKKCAEEFGL